MWEKMKTGEEGDEDDKIERDTFSESKTCKQTDKSLLIL